MEIRSSVSALNVWLPLPPLNNGGVRSAMFLEGLCIGVQKRAGAYHFKAFTPHDGVVYDSAYDNPRGWATPPQVRRAAENWAKRRDETDF